MSAVSLAVTAVAAVTMVAPPAPVAGTADLVARVTGPGSVSTTDARWGLKATDLGIMWDDGSGRILTAFGDSYGAGWTGPGGGAGDPATIDWRCQTLARSTDHRLSDGMSLDSFATDTAGHAKQLLPCAKDGNDDGGEVTVIPTAGVSVGHRQYLAYMSVRHWGAAGHWETNHAGIAYSDNDGQTWTGSAARWPNDAGATDPFQMVAFVHQGPWVYLYGTPSGRYGGVHLARVPERSVLDTARYQYWTGRGWRTGADTQAAELVPAPVGELSVQYNSYLRRWLMMYLEDPYGTIVLRQAKDPTGPWSDPTTVVSSAQYPGLYGGFLHPWSSSGRDLYFTMSQWDPYNVFLMHTTLSR